MLTSSRIANIVIFSVICLTTTFPERSSSQEIQRPVGVGGAAGGGGGNNTDEIHIEASGRSLLGDLGFLLGGKAANYAKTKLEGEEEDSDKKKKGHQVKNSKSKNSKKVEEDEEDETDDEKSGKPKKVKKKKVKKAKKKAVGILEAILEPVLEPLDPVLGVVGIKRKKLRPKYEDDDEEVLTDTDKNWLADLMDEAKEEQATFEKELVEEILMHAKQGDAEGAESAQAVAKKVKGYLSKLKDTAKEKGDDLYDKTTELFATVVTQAKKEGPVVVKQVKAYMMKVMSASGGDKGEKGPLSDEDKAFLAHLMAGVKWGDEDPNATPNPLNVIPTAGQNVSTPLVTPAPAVLPPVTSAPAVLPPVTQGPIVKPPIPASGTGSPPSSGPKFEQEALEAHNELRAKHKAPALKLSPQLTSVAQAWANNIAGRGKMQHSKTEYGENIYYTSTPDIATGREPSEKWYAEISYFDWNCLDCTFERTGHFTQLIWAGTSELGIAKASGPKGTYVVANYNPPGNFQGEYANNTLPLK